MLKSEIESWISNYNENTSNRISSVKADKASLENEETKR